MFHFFTAIDNTIFFNGNDLFRVNFTCKYKGFFLNQQKIHSRNVKRDKTRITALLPVNFKFDPFFQVC